MRYRVGEFAALTGVTVRALQHYDRLGLLRAARTESGHRVYSDADRQRVRHILALRTIGMSLHHIADLLKGPASQVHDALRMQCATLEQSRIAMDEAIHLLRQMEAQGSGGAGPLLDRLADGVEMQEALEAMRGYFSDEAWQKWGQHYFHDWPSAAWRLLFRDVEASLDEDPAGERAHELLNRSKSLWDAPIGSDPQLARAVREGYGKAWQARERWPSELRRRYAEFQIEAIAKFLGAAQMASWRRRGLIHTYTARQSAR
jgi:MerR family transcriptional regulator, thiopeptide resistance regulator